MTDTTPRSPAALDFLLTRRSRPWKTLETPVPDRDGLAEILTAAARIPDHGQLVPFRFVVLATPAMARLSGLVEARGRELGKSPEDIEKTRLQFASSPLAVAVVYRPQPSPKIPEVEQHIAAGNACLSLLNAALAAGWGANWITGWTAYDAAFTSAALGTEPGESVVGFVHIGTARATPPERPRPDTAAITTWIEA